MSKPKKSQIFDLLQFDQQQQASEEQFTMEQLEIILKDENENEERLRQLKIDILKKKRRTQLDVQLLVKLTMKMDYFIKINQKKGNIENDLHRKICQNLFFFFRKRGEFLFLQGDPPDYFYICIQGRSVTLVDIQPEELAKKRKPEHNPMLVHGLNQELTNLSKQKNQIITIRHILLIRFFQKMVLKLMRAMDLMMIAKTGIRKQIDQREKTPQTTQNRTSIDKSRKSFGKSVSFKSTANLNHLYCEHQYQNIRHQYNLQIKNQIDLDEIKCSFRMFDGNVIKHFWPAFFQAGSSFGELGFINKRPRSASILSLEDSGFGVLDQKGYESSVVESDKKRIRQTIEFIQGILFERGVQVSNERISKISFFFKKSKLQLSNTVYQQGELQKELFFIKKGEVEISHSVPTHIGEQNFRVTMLGPNEFMDDDDYFSENPTRIYNSKVISLKCTLFIVKRDAMDKLLKENRDILQFLREKWLNKKDFLHERLKKYLDFRFRDQIKIPLEGIQKYGKQPNDINKFKQQVLQQSLSVQKLREIEVPIPLIQLEQQVKQVKQKSLYTGKNNAQMITDDFTKMCDSLPQRRAQKLKSMVVKNQITQKAMGGTNIDVKELFLMTKEVGNFQLALRNFKYGKALNWNPQNDEAKVRSLVQNKLGIKQNTPKIDFLQNSKMHSRLSPDYSKSPNQTTLQQFYSKDAMQSRTLSQDIPWNILRQFHNTQSTDEGHQTFHRIETFEGSESDEKSKFIHLKDLKKEQYYNKKQKFKNANVKVSKFFQHLQCSNNNQTLYLRKDSLQLQPINNSCTPHNFSVKNVIKSRIDRRIQDKEELSKL